MTGAPIDPELLLRESAWLHAIARSLVGDPSAADDVVQETWLAALKRPPESREQGQVRAFLRTVVRRVAGSSARNEAARRRRERAASRDEAVAPESEGLERLALQRQIAEALLTLREPYRSAVVMRYVQDLAPREIAVRLDVSPEAVRTRISRGLELLRERLDREHGGDRSAWSAALIGIVQSGTKTTALASVFAGGIVGMKLALMTAAAVVAAVLLFTWLRATDEHGASLSTAAVREKPESAQPPDGTRGSEMATSPAQDARASIAGRSATKPTLGGRVVSALDRRPIAGARIELRTDDVQRNAEMMQRVREIEAAIKSGDSAREQRLVDDANANRSKAADAREVLATCGADGRFEIEALSGGDRALIVTADHFVSAVVREKALVGGGEIEIQLAPEGVLDVDVVDGAGAPIAAQKIAVSATGKTNAGSPLVDEPAEGSGTSDDGGRVSIGRLPVGVELLVRLDPQSGQPLRAAEQKVVIDAQERRSRITLRVETTGGLHGEVHLVAALDVVVQARFTPAGTTAKQLSTKVGSDGTFGFERVPAGVGSLEIAVIRRSERATTSVSTPLAIEIVAGKTTDVGVVDLPGVAHLRGHVRDWGDATGDYFAELRFLRDGIALACTVLDDQGRFEAWLSPGDCLIEVVNRGRSMASVPAHVPDEDFELDLLATCAALSGHLPDSLRETPMLFAHLEAGDTSSAGWEPSKKPEHAPFFVKDGKFRMQPLEPGRCSMLVPFGKAGTAWVPRIDLVRGQVCDIGELQVGFGSVRGRIVGADNKPVPGAEVILTSPFDQVLATVMQRHAIADEHGAFAFDAVPAGPWQASVPAAGGSVGVSSLADVFPNAASEIEVKLASAAALSVHVSSRGRGGSGLELVMSHLDGPAHATTDHTDSDGRIERSDLVPGTWHWSIADKQVLRAGTLVLHAGERRTLDIDLDAAAIVCHVVSPDGTKLQVLEAAAWSLDPATAGEMRLARSVLGDTFELGVDAGAWLIVMQTRAGSKDAQRTAVVQVPTGARTLDVTVSDVTLELNRTGANRHATPARALLVAMAGVRAESWGIAFTPSTQADSLRFTSLPPGATLRVEGSANPAGGRIVSLPQTGMIRLDWP